MVGLHYTLSNRQSIPGRCWPGADFCCRRLWYIRQSTRVSWCPTEICAVWEKVGVEYCKIRSYACDRPSMWYWISNLVIHPSTPYICHYSLVSELSSPLLVVFCVFYVFILQDMEWHRKFVFQEGLSSHPDFSTFPSAHHIGSAVLIGTK